MTKLAPDWVQTSDPVIRSPVRYRWTTAPALMDIRSILEEVFFSRENNRDDGTDFLPELGGGGGTTNASDRGGRNNRSEPKACDDKRTERRGEATTT